MKKDDFAALLVATIGAGLLVGCLGFGVGLLALDGFLKAVGLGIVFAFGGSSFVAIALFLIAPWRQ